jgi:hypothetical protein
LVRAKPKPLAVLFICHAIVGASLGLAACLFVLLHAGGGFNLVTSIRDPVALWTLSISISSLTAVGSAISAFILISIERAQT